MAEKMPLVRYNHYAVPIGQRNY